MPCLIRCDKCGDYCCENRLLTVNNDPLIIKAANLPPTPILCLVDKEWAPTGQVIGGDVSCVVLRKPGCYKICIDCTQYVGPAPGPGQNTELCYECVPGYDDFSKKRLGEDLSRYSL